MNLKLNINKIDYTTLGYTISILFHVLVFVITMVFMMPSDEDYSTGTYIHIGSFESLPSLEEVLPGKNNPREAMETIEKLKNSDVGIVTAEKEKTIVKETSAKNEITSDVKTTSKDKNTEKSDGSGNSAGSFYSFSDNHADTSNLVQYYKESTLNVSIKYPAGWKYIDQNVKNKLDGVTFWTTSGTFNPPPYVHIEVRDKDLFNPKRFKYKYETDNYTLYYNDPEELAGQFNQILYIRTDTNEDYSIKLIMNGEEAFKMFQPVFFGMVKSFKYGSGYF